MRCAALTPAPGGEVCVEAKARARHEVEHHGVGAHVAQPLGREPLEHRGELALGVDDEGGAEPMGRRAGHGRDEGENRRRRLARAGLAEHEEVAGEEPARERTARGEERRPLGDDEPVVAATPFGDGGRRTGHRHRVGEPKGAGKGRGERVLGVEQPAVEAFERGAVPDMTRSSPCWRGNALPSHRLRLPRGVGGP